MKKSTIRLFILSNALLSGIAFSQVGINTATPQATLDINSPGNTGATKSMRITNSNATETVTDQGRVGVGTTTPAGQFHVSTTGPNGIISERSNTNVGSPPYFNFRKNKSDNPTVNTPVVNTEILGAITFAGNTGNGYEGNAITGFSSIWSKAVETFSSTSQGSNLEFSTVPLGTATNAIRMTITDQGRVGIGNTKPAGQFHVASPTFDGIISERYSASDGPSYLVLKKNKSANPNVNGALLTNDAIGAITFQGNTGNGYEGNQIDTHSTIISYATENFTEATRGSKLEFRTVPSGTRTNVKRMTITDQGNVGIGTTKPEGQLHVSTTGPNGMILERANTAFNFPSYLSIRRNRSADPAVNVAVQNLDIIGAITFAGNTGNGYEGNILNGNTHVRVIAAENFTSTSQGSSMEFWSVPVGTAAAQSR